MKHHRIIGIVLLFIVLVVFVSYIPKVFATDNNVVDVDN